MRHDIELAWSVFKVQVLDTGHWKWLHFDIGDHYVIYAKQNDFTVLCKIHKDDGADQIDFENGYSTNHRLKSEVVTEFELDDKVLKLCSAVGDFDANGECVVEIEVPGDFDLANPSRYIAGGYANTDVYGWGDRCTEVNIVDKNNIMGYGAGFVLETYHDGDVAEQNRGWRFYASQGGEGEIEIEPIGGFGKIPGGLVLQIKFVRASGNTAQKVSCNIWWGKKT